MVAGITGTRIYDNVKLMMKTAILPLLLSAAVYGFSVRNPISHVDEALMQRFEEAFRLSLWAFVPAVFMLLCRCLRSACCIPWRPAFSAVLWSLA